MILDPLLQVASYTFSSNPSLRIFQRESPPNAPIQHILIAEPLLDWQRDEQGRPLINAVSRVQGGGAVFELRLIISTVESQQAAQRVVSSDEDLQKMKLITQIDSVNLALSKGTTGELLEFTGGEMYPSRNENVVVVDFESSSLTASKEDIEKVRSILRSVRLICKASVNGHELPPISLDFSTIAPSSSSSGGAAAAVNNAVAVPEKPTYQRFRAPHTPRSVRLAFGTIFRLAWTRSGNLVATTYGPSFYITKPNGEVIRQNASGTGADCLINTHGAAVSDEGLIFISDSKMHRVNVYTEEGEYIRSFGGSGNNNGQFDHPSSLTISKKTGNIFVADFLNHRIQVFNQAGKFLYLFGNPHINGPHGIDIDDDDNVFVAEHLGNKISVFTLEGQFLRSFGSAGSLPGQFNGLQQLYIDRPSGRILVAEYYNQRIQILNKFGTVEHAIPAGLITSAVVTDKDGKIIVGGFQNSTMLFYDN